MSSLISKPTPGSFSFPLPPGKVNRVLCLQPILIQKLCPQAKDEVVDLAVCQTEDFQIVPPVDGCHQDFEDFRLEIRRVILRVFLPELLPVLFQVGDGVNPVVVQVDEAYGVYFLLDLGACGSG